MHKEPSYAELVSYIERDPNKISLPDRRATRQWASPYNVMDTGDAKLYEANWDWRQQGMYVPPQSRAFDGPQQVQAPAPTKDIGNAFGGGVAQDPGMGPGDAPHGPFQPPPRPPRPGVRPRGAPIRVDPAPTMFDSSLYATHPIIDGARARAQAVPMDTDLDDEDMDDDEGVRPPHPPPWQGPDATAQQLQAEVQADHVRNVMNHLAWQMQRPQAVPQPIVTDHEASLFQYGGLPPPPPPPPTGGIVNQAQAGLTALGGAAWALSRNQVAGLVNREVVQPVAAALNRHVVEPTVGPAIRQAQQAVVNGAEGFAQSVANRVGLGQAAATAEELAPLVAGGAAEAVGAAEAAAMAVEGLGEGFAVGGPLGGVIGLGLGLGGAVLAHQLSETPQHQPVMQAHGDVWHNTASAAIPPAAQAQINNSGTRHIPAPVMEHDIWTEADDAADAGDEEMPGRGVRRPGSEAIAGSSARRPRVATFAEDAMVPMGRGIKRSVPLPYRKQGSSAYLPKEEQHPLARLGNALATMPSSMPGSDVPSQMPKSFSSSEAESVPYTVAKRPPPPPGGGASTAIRRHALPEAPVMPFDPFADPEYQQVFGNAALEHQIAHAGYDPARADQTLQARVQLAKSKLPTRAAASAAILPFAGSASDSERGPSAAAARRRGGTASARSRSDREAAKTPAKNWDGPLATSFGAKKAQAGNVSDSSRSARRGAIDIRPRNVKSVIQ